MNLTFGQAVAVAYLGPVFWAFCLFFCRLRDKRKATRIESRQVRDRRAWEIYLFYMQGKQEKQPQIETEPVMAD